MGWLKPKPASTITDWPSSYPSSPAKDKDDVLSTAKHLERIDSYTDINTTTNTTPGNEKLHPFQPSDLSDAELPFIPSTVVKRSLHSLHRVWLVIDNVVYDATDFLHEHPGGNTVIESFAGQDCSWQFWRFHHREHLRDSGRSLRVGRTAGVQNRFKERPRFVGLKRLDGWGW